MALVGCQQQRLAGMERPGFDLQWTLQVSEGDHRACLALEPLLWSLAPFTDTGTALCPPSRAAGPDLTCPAQACPFPLLWALPWPLEEPGPGAGQSWGGQS